VGFPTLRRLGFWASQNRHSRSRIAGRGAGQIAKAPGMTKHLIASQEIASVNPNGSDIMV
jgi:hypothetical protein